MVKPVFVFLFSLVSIFHIPIQASEWQRIIIDGNVSIQVEVVTSTKEKAQGLGNRFSLPEGMGMLFQYNQAGEYTFWMKGMHFPIDILWINRGAVVHIEKKVPPPRPGTSIRSLPVYGHGIKADMILEVPAGYSTKKAITVGSKIRFTKD